ncbi:anthranilate synthase component I family protein [Nocardioides alcanivorans]|uniref:anthranilate synthase component I family protein n=1 Tax=Nocardioides alcanivorans TaxID=2897352 RepID=UPI001F29B255|nr:anthranilate synthase component I family protein [Nocardioides alcanivorans]
MIGATASGISPSERFAEVASKQARCFWLDGGGARSWSGRRSLIGWLDDDDLSLTHDAVRQEVVAHRSSGAEVVGSDIFEVLGELVARDRDRADPVHWVGYFGYPSRSDLPASIDPDDPAPTAVWMRARHVEFYRHDSEVGVEAEVAGPSAGGAVPSDYLTAFDRVQEHLRAGNSYEVNLTHREQLTGELDPIATYLRLRRLNPAPYAGFLQHDGSWLLSSSPERFATIDAERWVETKPIKGTTPRGATTEEDDAHRRRLAQDPKFRAENLMIVDLLRNDLAMVCEPGTVQVPVLMEVESYRSVHQLVSTVRGRLRPELSTIEALRALFPAGSMTGAPKLRTMEIIAEVESSARGAYSGAFGWIAPDGRADLGVIIRSLSGGTDPDGRRRWQLGTGGGITVASDAVEEFAETQWKAALLRQARC